MVMTAAKQQLTPEQTTVLERRVACRCSIEEGWLPFQEAARDENH
jgi:hypothetical protein